MKLLSRHLAVTLLMVLTTNPTFADCQTYTGGYTECTGPQGYQSSSRSYTGGVQEYQDNRGNSATVRHDGMGGVSVIAPTGVVPSVVPSQPYQHQMYPSMYPSIYPR